MAYVRDIPKRTEYKKISYMDFTVGTHIIRVLQEDKDSFMTFVHYIAKYKMTVACLGDDCPLCEMNRKIWTEDSKNARNNPNYASRSQKYAVNVLDRTLAKVCPNCGAEMKKSGSNYPAACTSCNTMITEVPVKPLNKVKVLAKGVKFFGAMDGINSSVLDENDTPIGITHYDLQVTIMQPKADPLFIPLTGNKDVVEVDPKEFYNLQDSVLKLNREEIIDVLKGVALKDIFTARNSGVVIETETDELVEKAAEQAKDVSEQIKELYGE